MTQGRNLNDVCRTQTITKKLCLSPENKEDLEFLKKRMTQTVQAACVDIKRFDKWWVIHRRIELGLERQAAVEYLKAILYLI